MERPVIAIIGAGAVGATAAYTLIMRNISAKIVIFDSNTNKCRGEMHDLSDALSMYGVSTVCAGSLQEAGQADIIVITAGIPQKPGQTRLELLKTNVEVVQSIIQKIKPIKKSSIIIVVTNPIDILTRVVQDVSGLPKNQVFGSGTFLDTQRLRSLLGERLHIHPHSIHAYVLGEHGDSQFVAWAAAHIGGIALSAFSLKEDVLHDIALKARQRAYDIIAGKGCTAFGIASAIATYCEDILTDAKRVLPLSCFAEKLGVCLSVPAVLGAGGVEHILYPVLSKEEQEKLAATAQILQQQYENIKGNY